jgi:repressor LexA
MKLVSPRQTATLKVIQNYIKQKGFAPSVRDISDQMGGISPNAVHQHLVALERKGRIKRDARIARSIIVLS